MAISYINRMGVKRSYTLSEMACNLWSRCLERRRYLSAEHLPDIYNVIAYVESRTLPSSSEWKVNKTVVRSLEANDKLSLKILSQKLVALVEASRSSELLALDLRFRAFKPDGVKFQLPTLTKKRERLVPFPWSCSSLHSLAIRSCATWRV